MQVNCGDLLLALGQVINMLAYLELRSASCVFVLVEASLLARGNIFDRNDGALTRNIAHYTISVDPSKITEKIVLAKKLHKITGRPLDYYINKLNSNKNFEFLDRNLKNNIIEEKQFQSFSGLNIKKHYRRTYPHGSIAGQILGYTDTDDIGISGIEKDYNKFLSGTPGQVIKSKGCEQ